MVDGNLWELFQLSMNSLMDVPASLESLIWELRSLSVSVAGYPLDVAKAVSVDMDGRESNSKVCREFVEINKSGQKPIGLCSEGVYMDAPCWALTSEQPGSIMSG